MNALFAVTIDSRLRCTLAFVIVLAACAGRRTVTPTAAASIETNSGTAAASVAGRRVVSFEGMCDASGAVELDERRFLVADDEDNVLRVYDADRGGRALSEIDLAPLLALEGSKREVDLESATHIGQNFYFLASHARTKKGKRDPDRLLFFGLRWNGDATAPSLLGQPCRSLLSDLTEHPLLARFELTKAAELGPKEPGGLNIEGLTADTDGSLLIGFRNPIPQGRALLVRMRNPDQLLNGERIDIAEPVLLDLGGLGVRSLTSWRGRLLLIAGPSGDGGPFHLFELDAGLEGATPVDFDFTGFGPEGFFTPDARDELLVLSDDGTQLVNGKACKRVKDDALKHFRGIWLRPELPASGTGRTR